MQVETLPVTQFYGIAAFRYSAYDTPFWARDNKTSGRWNSTGTGATQYLSLHPDGAWAELARHENLRTEEELAEVRTTLWTATVHQLNVVDYSNFTKAEKAGFPPDALIDDDHTRCQEEAVRLRKLGHAGVLTPSAALPGAVNLTIFGRRVRTTFGIDSRLASAIPACAVAVGSPPPGLASRVRYVGEVHTGYEAYLDLVAERNRQDQVSPPVAEDEERELEAQQPGIGDEEQEEERG